MSYLRDKIPCSVCGDLYDPDMLNWENVCRWCVIEASFMDDVYEDWRNEGEDDG